MAMQAAPIGEIISGITRGYYVKSPIVDILDQHNRVIWSVENPNYLVEALCYEQRIGAITCKSLQIVKPEEFRGIFIEERSWMNCTNCLQQSQQLTGERIQIGEKLSDTAYTALVHLAYPAFPLPNYAPFITHFKYKT